MNDNISNNVIDNNISNNMNINNTYNINNINSNNNNNIQVCTYRKEMKCFYLTKENKDDFIRFLVNSYLLKQEDCDIEYNNHYIKIEYETGWTYETKYNLYDRWYVLEYDETGRYYRINSYTDNMFNKKFILQ